MSRPAVTVPAVSVIVPAFNASATIARALDSLLSQSFQDFEIVVVEDGSTDSTSPIVNEFARRDPRVRVLHHQVNLGLVVSLNDGLSAARAGLVARLDADDVALPLRLERQTRIFAMQPDVVLCATAYERVAPDGRVVKTVAPPQSHGALAGALLTGNCLCHSSVMFKRSSVADLGGYTAEWFPAEDYDLWIRLLSVGRYQGIGTVEVQYSENPTGVSASSTSVQSTTALRRAAAYVSASGGGPLVEGAAVPQSGASKTAEQQRDEIRSLSRATQGLASNMRSRGIDTSGVYAAALGASQHMLGDQRRVARNLLLLRWAPRLALAGRMDRLRSR